MNKLYRNLIIIIIGIIAIVGIIVTVVSFSLSHNALSRYEWIKMLCEREGIDQFESDTPFYEDVDTSNDYYNFIQSAVESDIIPLQKSFNGNKPSTGRFVALTAMRSVGKSRIKISQDIEGDIFDDDFINIAVDHDLISKSMLGKPLSEEDCTLLLDKLDNLYYSDFLKDDYEKIKYTDIVTEIPDDDVVEFSSDYSSLSASPKYNNLSIGDVVVFNDNRSNCKIARKVDSINNGIMSLSDATLEETIEELKISDIAFVRAQDIINHYDCDKSDSVITTSVFKTDKPIEFSGFSIKVDTDTSDGYNVLGVSIIDIESGIKYQLPIDVVLEDNERYSGEFNVNKIALAGIVDYTALEGLNYADIALDIDMSVNAGIESKVSKRIPLFEVPIPLAGGATVVIIKINLVVDANGSLSLSSDIPVLFDVGYNSSTGKPKLDNSISVENGELLIDCKGSVSGEAQGILSILHVANIVDAEISVGAEADANGSIRQNGMICTDIDAKAPVVKFAVCNDSNAHSLLGEVYDTDRLETVIDQKSYKYHFHHEVYPDGKEAFVDECTYKNTEIGDIRNSFDDIAKDQTDSASDKDGSITTVELDQMYMTKYGMLNEITCPTFMFEYSSNWHISDEKYDEDGVIEEVVLENDNGAKIIFLNYSELGYGGRAWMRGNTTKAADSLFIPSYPAGSDTDMSSLGSFVVAQVHITGNLEMGLDDDYYSVEDDDSYSTYGVIPENRLGDFTDVEGEEGLYDLLSFEYPSTKYCFIANPPENGWSKEERFEAISTLSSFRVAG